jgi:uncharacterized protein (TIGR02145 family)
MKKIALVNVIILFINVCSAQNVGIGTLTPENSAELDVSSTTKGFLPPRLTFAQRNAIQNPVAGLTVWCTDCNEMQVYNGFLWKNMSGHAASNISYPFIKLCNDTWMLKNLAVRTYRNGDSIPVITDPTQWSNLTTGAMCWFYNNPTAYDSIFGPMYNWYAVNDPRGIAPVGWHVASDKEWRTASECVGGDSIAAIKMRDTSNLWNYTLPFPVYADNASGFTALPGGLREVNGTYQSLGSDGGFWWTSTQTTINTAWARLLAYDGAFIIYYDSDNKNGYYIRCVKD